MYVRFNRRFRHWQEGATAEIPHGLAIEFIKRGAATEVKDSDSKPKPVKRKRGRPRKREAKP